MKVRFSTTRADADQLHFTNASSSSADQEAPKGPADGYGILIDKDGLGDYRLKPRRILLVTKAVTKAKGTWLQPWLTVTNNNVECLEYVKTLYGGRRSDVKEGRGHHLRFYTPKDVKRVLSGISPYLIVKKEQAKVMLAFCESRLSHPHLSYTSNEWAWYEALKTLNNA